MISQLRELVAKPDPSRAALWHECEPMVRQQCEPRPPARHVHEIPRELIHLIEGDLMPLAPILGAHARRAQRIAHRDRSRLAQINLLEVAQVMVEPRIWMQ